MLKESFQVILESYLEDRTTYNALPPPRKFTDIPSAKALTKSLPEQLKLSCSLTDDYALKGSTGKGNIAEIPHVCLFDKTITTSATTGYYIVYFFDATFSKAYLSLNQGWTQYQKKFGIKEGRKKILDTAKKAQQLLRSSEGFSFNPIVLNTKGTLGKGYELGNICSIIYEKDNLPEDATLINDLRNLVGIYRELKGLVGNSILEIDIKANSEYYKYKIKNQTYSELPKEDNQWIAEEDNGKPIADLEPPEYTLNTSNLSTYTPEFASTYITNSSTASTIHDRRHGIVVNTLAQTLEVKGFKVLNDQYRDLVAEDLNGVKKLFEVKTSFILKDLYTAVGQLLIYSIPFTEIEKTIDLILVLPMNLNVKLEEGLLAYGITVINYQWQNAVPVFQNLNMLLTRKI